MKSFIAVLLVVIFASISYAQDANETVTIPKSELTEKQRSDLSDKELQDKVSQYGKWVGIGHEVGIAVNDGLTAVTTQANNFSQTPVGKWTIFVIIFKVVGEKAIQYMVGISMLLFGLPIWIWSYRKYLPRKYLTKRTFGEDEKKLTEEYDYGYGGIDRRNSLSADNASKWAIGHWIILAVFTGITLAVMFTGN